MVKDRFLIILLVIFFVLTVINVLVFRSVRLLKTPPVAQDESQSKDLDEREEDSKVSLYSRLKGLEDWKRPDGPRRVAIQIGHWEAFNAPDELEKLRINTGTSSAGKTEWEVAMSVAERTKKILEEKGFEVELLPVTIPSNYWADVFISIHADGNDSSVISGYKVAPSKWDYTRKADAFAEILDEEYGRATRMRRDPNITKTMEGYYAFNWPRYEHSLHPMTVAAIIELGFLTNANDRRIIVNEPDKSALGIANGIVNFFSSETVSKEVGDAHTGS